MSQFEREMQQMRAKFLVRISTDLEALRAALARKDLATIDQLAHRLAGVGGMYGHPEISRIASTVENAIGEGDEAAAHGRTNTLIAVLEEIEPD